MTPDTTEDLVRRDALAGSMRSYLWAAVGCVFAAALCAAVFRESLLAPARWWWLSAMVLMQGTTVATALTYMRDPRSRGLRAWMTPFLVCSVAQGLLWSGLPLLLHGPSMTETQWAMLLIFYSVSSAAAIATLCANYVISASYFAALWLPAIAQLLLAGGTTNPLFALGGAMLLGLALVFAHYLHVAMLEQVGARLSAAMQEGDTVARLGGDEFVVLVHGAAEADAHHVAERLVQAMEAPFTMQGQELLVSASVGIAWSDGSIAPPELLVNTDRAMFRAKETGRRRTVTYDREMAQWMDAHRGMEQDLRRAIGAGQREVAAQPIVDLATRLPVGVELLARFDARPEALCVELTETASADDLPTAGMALGTLRAMGVGVAIDDFGTGWSSLTYLHALPATSVKVDRSFVAIADRDARAAAIVRACAELAGVDGRASVAEGIETEAQAALSRRLECTHGQGWLFGRPAPVVEVEQLLREALSLPAAADAAA